MCRTLPEDSDREIGDLKAIKDNFPKYVVIMDSAVCGIEDEIKIVHVSDFFLAGSGEIHESSLFFNHSQ